MARGNRCADRAAVPASLIFERIFLRPESAGGFSQHLLTPFLLLLTSRAACLARTPSAPSEALAVCLERSGGPARPSGQPWGVATNGPSALSGSPAGGMTLWMSGMRRRRSPARLRRPQRGPARLLASSSSSQGALQLAAGQGAASASAAATLPLLVLIPCCH